MGRVKIRLTGLPEDVYKAITTISQTFTIITISPKDYKVHGSEKEIRKYLEIEV